MYNFVIIVDNEVVGNVTYSDDRPEGSDMSKVIAIYSSDPRFIPHHRGPVEIGSTWDGKKFIPPVR